jgi:hypothetical protein
MPDPKNLPENAESRAATAGGWQVDSVLLLEEDEFTRQMGWRPQDLRVQEARNRVFHMVVGGALQYPAFYVRLDAGGRRQLAAVCQLLGDLPGGSKWQFFTGGKGSLGGLTPLEALRMGRLPQVKACARAFAER